MYHRLGARNAEPNYKIIKGARAQVGELSGGGGWGGGNRTVPSAARALR